MLECGDWQFQHEGKLGSQAEFVKGTVDLAALRRDGGYLTANKTLI